MNIALFAYSRKGLETARKISQFYEQCQVRKFSAPRINDSDFGIIPPKNKAFYGEQFMWADALIFVGSCGIAVRMIAPFVKDKTTDPAVIVVDECAKFAIPLLSGHLGGACALAKDIAQWLNATAVITTATDLNGRFSVDTWAGKHGYILSDMTMAKLVSAHILEGDIPFCSDSPVRGLPKNGLIEACEGEIGIYIGYYKKWPYAKTLQVIPKVLHIGIGCRRGTEKNAIEQAVCEVFDEYSLDFRAAADLASIDLKANEAGLLEYAKSSRLPVTFYTAGQLREVMGEFCSSDFVSSITGVDNVCERAAMMRGHRLIVKKTVKNGVTVAVAAENMEVSFE